jgi:hypothetical protein
MDSMRSLNTSLPKAKTMKAAAQPDIHQAFRTAALSVTNLYKSAIADLEKSRSEGQQEILDDLLAFLDRQRLGLDGSGEGARIRQWALERLDGQATGNSDSEEDVLEERDQQQRRARSSSPALELSDSRSSANEAAQTAPSAPVPSYPPHPIAEDIIRPDSAPQPSTQPAPPPHPIETEDTILPDNLPNLQSQPPQSSVFQFQSPQPYPTFDTTNEMPDPSPPSRRNLALTRRSASRASRNLHRAAAANNLLTLGNGAGQKRKLMDFFNVDGFYDRREGHGGGGCGGGKRGRPC